MSSVFVNYLILYVLCFCIIVAGGVRFTCRSVVLYLTFVWSEFGIANNTFIVVTAHIFFILSIAICNKYFSSHIYVIILM